MNVHFIAIGGSAMHNLAIALSRKGANVTGSDDEIFEPSRTRLEKQGILPVEIGWFPEKINAQLDAVILGMHAREDNPELLKAKELGLAIFSYPEYLYEQSKNKTRVVIGGSHGKTTITSMLLHVVNALGMNVDYMVGAQLEGYDCMVKLTDEAKVMILEGDEYLSSPIDRRPKFHLYKPDVAIISGIAWDHINVFPTFENYVEQFDTFCSLIAEDGTLIYNQDDIEVDKLGVKFSSTIETVSYQTPEYDVTETGTLLHFNGEKYPLKIFGSHNLQNLMGAMRIGQKIGIEPDKFFKAIQSFTGAGKRLQKVAEKGSFTMYKDFAHSPSKLKATTKAVKEQYEKRHVVACMELHTFSSLKKEFLPHYENAMHSADEAIVYFSHEVVAHKKLEPITKEMVAVGFGGGVTVLNETQQILDFIHSKNWNNSVLLMMSSGNFDGINYEILGEELSSQLK
ncbi:MAG: UDP-N-acetylmuramate--L-alanine ligase [Flavobacteriia bacterium]|jgi:UDP-N-acetylmuramate: L-alanyl-gamma-D-glutamyl-meso-diaminopimelate ligase